MRICGIRVLRFKSSSNQPTGVGYDMYNSHALIELRTESEIGYGSASTTGDLCEAAIKVLIPLIIGESISSAKEVCALWEKLDRSTQWLGGGAVTAARSALDIAAWDAVGKHLDQPVWQLLRTKTKEEGWTAAHKGCLRTIISNRQFPQTRVKSCG